MIKPVQYRKITVRSGELDFSVYCTQDSWENNHDHVMQWVRSLARRLQWEDYKIAATRTTELKATERPHALFETRFNL